MYAIQCAKWLKYRNYNCYCFGYACTIWTIKDTDPVVLL